MEAVGQRHNATCFIYMFSASCCVLTEVLDGLDIRVIVATLAPIRAIVATLLAFAGASFLAFFTLYVCVCVCVCE